VAIPQTALLVTGPFGAALSAEDVARAIARGLLSGGQPAPDLCPLEETSHDELPGAVRAHLDALDFDARMRRARAVVLVERRLAENTLRGSAAFEIATRARQGGVPAYAVAGKNALALIDARILDLQVILEANDERTLTSAGRKLARLL
jgi:glycerate kinase